MLDPKPTILEAADWLREPITFDIGIRLLGVLCGVKFTAEELAEWKNNPGKYRGEALSKSFGKTPAAATNATSVTCGEPPTASQLVGQLFSPHLLSKVG
jgi:hypothetical protein